MDTSNWTFSSSEFPEVGTLLRMCSFLTGAAPCSQGGPGAWACQLQHGSLNRDTGVGFPEFLVAQHIHV